MNQVNKKEIKVSTRNVLLIFIGLTVLNSQFHSAISMIGSLGKQKLRLKSCPELCLTSKCREQANKLSNMMDKKVNPCDDFYKFVCGNYIKKSEVNVSLYYEGQEKLLDEIISEIENPINLSDLKAFKKIKTYYQNCMNASVTEIEDASPLLEVLNRIGGFPLLIGNKWNEDVYDWKDMVYKIIDVGLDISFPINTTVFLYNKNFTKFMIQISKPHDRKEDYDGMMKTTKFLGVETDRAADDIKAVIEFQTKLLNNQVSDKDSEKVMDVTESDDTMTIEELTQKYPSIPWLDFLNRIFNPNGVFVNDTEVINVTDLNYLTRLENLLRITPKRTIANYLLIRFINDNQIYSPEKLKNLNREEMCFDEVKTYFELGISAMYTRMNNVVNKRLKNSALKIAKDIKNQGKKRFKEVEWLDSKTRDAALDKLESMELWFGYADELVDDRKVEDYYEELEINPGNYWWSDFNITLFMIKKHYRWMMRPDAIKHWTLWNSAVEVNAYYHVYNNIIEIPIGYLRTFFYLDMPNYLNYGSTGTAIGHEMIHGFDNDGRKYDRNGNEKNWWQASTEENFFRKARCIIDQYGNFTVDEVGLNVNGELTESENMADNGGWRIAYYAYNEWVKSKNVTEPCLPKLPYSQKQLFWINAASTMCSTFSPESIREDMLTDGHSPHRVRILLTLSNIKEFSEDFNCKLGTPMNPKKKCVVW